MNSRERVLTALKHREADRVPVDLGGTPVTSITLSTYGRLLRYLGIEDAGPRLYMPFNQTVEVDEKLLNLVGGDARPVYPGAQSWKKCILDDGFSYEVPDKWTMQRKESGLEVVLDEDCRVFAQRAAGADYFQRPYTPLKEATSIADLEKHARAIEYANVPFYLDETLEDLGKRVKRLFESTDCVLVGNFSFPVYMGGQRLRGWENFMVDLIANQAFAKALMDRIVESHMKWFEYYMEAVRQYIQIIMVADDLGTQEGLQLHPNLYRKVVKPYHKKLYQFIKDNSDAYLFFHTDGSVYELIPDFIEMGIDILNPIQSSVKNMKPLKLKQEFGKDLIFWGGGCAAQDTLPFGTPKEVKEEVMRRIDELAPGGGFVFAQDHIIPAGTPPENIVAMYEAVREYGSY